MTQQTKWFDILRNPVYTEKALGVSDGDAKPKVTFRIAVDADKEAVQQAVEGIFKLKVVKVNVMHRAGKNKVFKGKRGKRASYKKAIVTFEQKTDISSIVGA